MFFSAKKLEQSHDCVQLKNIPFITQIGYYILANMKRITLRYIVAHKTHILVFKKISTTVEERERSKRFYLMEKVFSRGQFQFQGKHNFSLVQTHILQSMED